MSLEVKNLTKQYGEKVVVDGLSFSLTKPGVYALLGTNGAGKTTSLRMILGMLSTNGGEVLWKGEPLDSSKLNIGYLAVMVTSSTRIAAPLPTLEFITNAVMRVSCESVNSYV